MNKVNIISLLPEVISKPLEYGVLGKALQSDVLQLDFYNPRDFVGTNYKGVDDKPFGGGEGMLLQCQPFEDCLNSIKDKGRVVLLSPQGETWSNGMAQEWAVSDETVTLVCGRYEGIDQRFINKYVDKEISIGDYVLSGGEIGALVVLDSMVRFMPGSLGNEDSALKDSFSEGLLKAPSFTRPAEYDGETVPEVLLSGHHKNIEQWKRAFSLVITHIKRPDLVAGLNNSVELKQSYEYVLGRPEKELKVCGLDKPELINKMKEI